MLFLSSDCNLKAWEGCDRDCVDIYVFVVLGVDLFLQQQQQVVQTTGKLLPLHLHKQAADLSPETPQARLGGGGNASLNSIIHMNSNVIGLSPQLL